MTPWFKWEGNYADYDATILFLTMYQQELTVKIMVNGIKMNPFTQKNQNLR